MATVLDSRARLAATERARRTSDPARRPPGLRSTPARQRRMPWIALGLLLVFGAGLAFAGWSRATSKQVAVLVAARDIDAGDVVDAGAVRVSHVALGSDVKAVRAGDRAAVVGKVARGLIPSGTLIGSSMVTTGPIVPAGHAVVGAVLAAGAYPTASLRPGDAVELIATAGANEPGASAEPLGTGRVWSVSDPRSPGGSGLFVSLLVPSDRAATVSNAAALQRLRLVLVGTGQ
jgi:hypothetical protein